MAELNNAKRETTSPDDNNAPVRGLAPEFLTPWDEIIDLSDPEQVRQATKRSPHVCACLPRAAAHSPQTATWHI